MEITTKERDMQHTITLIANLNCGDLIVRTSNHGVRRMPRTELAAHAAAGATIIERRKGVRP
jgi:hypothetical protein